MKAPEFLQTARLILRRPVASDTEEVFLRYASDREVTRYLAWETHRSPADTRGFVAWSDREWERWPASAYLIRSRADGTLLGGTGLSFESPTRAATGYALARDSWGQGYATEALTAMVLLARALGVKHLHALCHTEHRASARVLDKCGFRRDRTLHRYAGFPNLEPSASCDVYRYSRRP